MKKINEVVLLGRSKKFTSIFRDIFPDSTIKIIPWRECAAHKISTKDSIDLLVICGYDYRSSWYPFSKYLQNNIYNPLECIKNLTRPKTIIFYIDTKDESKNYTYSRYRYAKNIFGGLLLDEFSHLKKISPPVIMNEKNEIDIHSGFLSKIILTTLVKMKIVESISRRELLTLIVKTINQNDLSKYHPIKPKFLKIIRPHIIDRAMRLILG
jgi:hypothetical protein